MAKLSPEDLDKIREDVKKVLILREGIGRARITVHMGTCGIAAGARAIMKALVSEVVDREIKDVVLATSSCAGLCSKEPMITVEIQGEPPVKYIELTPQKVKEIFEKHILQGKIVKEYALAFGGERTA
jgi:NADP-reducing hydrogenase subunit HndB